MPDKAFSQSPSIVGSWSLIEAWDLVDDGEDPKRPKKKIHLWGEPPAGYWVYDRSGHFSLMISRNPPLPAASSPFPSRDASHELFVETFSNPRPYAYFGTYTVELDASDPTLGGVIHHRVFSDVLRTYTGTVQLRKFRFDGRDHLNVGEPGVYLRRLQRLSE